MKTKKNQIWNFNNEIDAEVCGGREAQNISVRR